MPPATDETRLPGILPALGVTPVWAAAMLAGVWRYLTGVSVCISPIANDAEHLFVPYVPPVPLCDEVSVRVFCPFSNWVVFHCWLLRVLDPSPLSIPWLATVFP